MTIVVKETMKVKIKRLEDEKKADLDLIQKLNQEILSMQEKADQAFENSTYKKQLEQQLAFEADRAKVYKNRTEQEETRNNALRNQIQELDHENKRLKAELSTIKAKPSERPHNERNAGRKPRITQKQIAEIQMLRAQGMTLQAIQKEMKMSYGLVQKYCKIIK